MSLPTASVRSWENEVLEVFEERRQNGSSPSCDVMELFAALKEEWSDIRDVGVAFAVGRLVCDGKLRYALDGICLAQRRDC